jgi:hypothetical protein
MAESGWGYHETALPAYTTLCFQVKNSTDYKGERTVEETKQISVFPLLPPTLGWKIS